MRRLLILTIFAVLGVCPSAGAVTLVNPDGSRAEPFQTWANQMLVPAPQGVVEIKPNDYCGHRPDGEHLVSGCASPGGAIGISASLCSSDQRECRFVLRHEIGHFYDYAMPEWKRVAFRRIIRKPDSEWRTNAFDSPHETFAVAYAWVSSYATVQRALRAHGLDPFWDDGRHDMGRGFILERRTFGRIARLIRQPN